MASFVRRIFSVLILLLAVTGVKPLLAQNLYTVSGIHVDATAASSTAALNAAIDQGRPKAFQILYRRLTRQSDWERQPNLDFAGLVHISRGYTIANERRSTTRYVADVTYMFNPEAVERLLRANSIAFTQTEARRILVIAMAPGVGHGPWSQALMSPQLRESLVPFSVMGPEDDSQLSGLNFDTAGWSDVSEVAQKYHVGEVDLVQAIDSQGKISVNIRALSNAQAPTKDSVDVAASANVNATYPQAAQAGVDKIEDMWKARSAIDFSQRGHLTADVRIASLSQWGELQNQLAGISNVTDVEVSAMDMDYAEVRIAYMGGIAQLREALAAAGLELASPSSGHWTLARAPDSDQGQ